MPGNNDTVAAIRHELKDYLHRFPADVHEPAVSLAMCTFCKTRFTNQIQFLGRCLLRKVIPVGFSIKFHASSLSYGYVKNVRSITYTCSRNLWPPNGIWLPVPSRKTVSDCKEFALRKPFTSYEDKSMTDLIQGLTRVLNLQRRENLLSFVANAETNRRK